MFAAVIWAKPRSYAGAQTAYLRKSRRQVQLLILGMGVYRLRLGLPSELNSLGCRKHYFGLIRRRLDLAGPTSAEHDPLRVNPGGISMFLEVGLQSVGKLCAVPTGMEIQAFPVADRAMAQFIFL